MPHPGPGRAATTLSALDDAPQRSSNRILTLSWLHPRPEDPPLALDFPSGEARLIGREEGVAVRLSDPNVSRKHAKIHREGSAFFLVDLGSRNGTRVNGRLAAAAQLLAGTLLRLGDTVGMVTEWPGPVTEIAPSLHAGALLENQLSAVRRIARSDLPIVLEGETGTGKEVVARTIHAWSGRSGPFVAINCAALPEGLAESELFGHRRGAFTGADRASPGVFRSADRGTLLLDEVVDLPLVVQAKLLRVLEQREVQPLGESQPLPIDVRVVVAAQSPLWAAVQREAFRADLLARLEGVTARIPPLRERSSDVPALFQRLFAKDNDGAMPAVGADFVERLCLYDWPFNVREVVLLAKRLRVLCDPGKSLRARDLPARMLGGLESAPSAEEPATTHAGALMVGSTGESGESAELGVLLGALRACQGNVAQAAVAMGISRQRAYRMMQVHAVDLDAVRREVQPEDEK